MRSAGGVSGGLRSTPAPRVQERIHESPVRAMVPGLFRPRGCFLGLREMQEGTSCEGAGDVCRAAPVTPNSDGSPAGHLAVQPPGQPRAQRDLPSSSTTGRLDVSGKCVFFFSSSHAIKTNFKGKLRLVPNEGSCLESELKYFISSLNFCSIRLVPSRVLLNHFS